MYRKKWRRDEERLSLLASQPSLSGVAGFPSTASARLVECGYTSRNRGDEGNGGGDDDDDDDDAVIQGRTSSPAGRTADMTRGLSTQPLTSSILIVRLAASAGVLIIIHDCSDSPAPSSGKGAAAAAAIIMLFSISPRRRDILRARGGVSVCFLLLVSACCCGAGAGGRVQKLERCDAYVHCPVSASITLVN